MIVAVLVLALLALVACANAQLLVKTDGSVTLTNANNSGSFSIAANGVTTLSVPSTTIKGTVTSGPLTVTSLTVNSTSYGFSNTGTISSAQHTCTNLVIAGTSYGIGATGAITGVSLNVGTASGNSVTGGSLTIGSSSSISNAGAITGTSLGLGTGLVSCGALTVSSTASITILNAGAITGTSLNVGSGTITGTALTIASSASINSAGAIVGTSLNVGSGTITGTALTIASSYGISSAGIVTAYDISSTSPWIAMSPTTSGSGCSAQCRMHNGWIEMKGYCYTGLTTACADPTATIAAVLPVGCRPVTSRQIDMVFDYYPNMGSGWVTFDTAGGMTIDCNGSTAPYFFYMEGVRIWGIS